MEPVLGQETRIDFNKEPRKFVMGSLRICIFLSILMIVGSLGVYTYNKNIKVGMNVVHANNAPIQTLSANIPVFSEKIGVPILAYHKIATADKLDGVPNNMVVTPEELEEQMAYFKKQGYETITFMDLYGFLHDKKPIPQKSIILSFDDGYQSNYTYLPPLLKKYGMKAEIAVVTGATRKVSGEVTSGASYFTWEHAKELQQSGFINLDSHTANHVNLAKSDNLEVELKGSSNDIKSYLGKRPTVIVYPGGSYSKKVIEDAEKYGYVMGATIEAGVNYFGQDPMIVKRFLVNHGDTGEFLLNKISRYKRR